MTKQTSIVLARARGLGSLPSLLIKHAGQKALDKAFMLSSVPILAKDKPNTPISMEAMINLFGIAARQVGSRTFGLEVGRSMNHAAYGSWVEFANSAPTLERAIARICATRWAHMSGCPMEIDLRNEHWMLQVMPPVRGSAGAQHSDHVIYPLLTFMRLYLGSDWRPSWIELNYDRDAEAYLLEEDLQTPIHFGCKHVAIAISKSDINAQRPTKLTSNSRIVTLRDVIADVEQTKPAEPANALLSVLALRLLDGKSDIDGAARMTGLSIQSLQRRLRGKGFTYKEALEAARRERGISLLLETDLTIAEIAFSLGYEEHPNFTRAFNRWMGCSPTIFRQLRAKESLQWSETG